MKVAIIGRGFGVYAMQPAFEAEGWDVEIIPSRDDAAVAAALAKPFDLIAVHSPPFQHRQHVLAAIAAGHNVLCDKPFGRNGAEAREMRDAAKAAGVLHFLNFEFRQGKSRMKVAELLNSGAIGTLHHINYAQHASFMRGRGYGWLNDAEQGGGWLGALGSHIIDAILWYFARPIVDCGGVSRVDVPLRKNGDGAMQQCTAEDAFSIWMTMQGGGTAALDSASCASITRPQSTVLLGSEGALELINDTVLTLHKYKAEPQVFDFTPQPGDPAWPALHDWVNVIADAIRGGNQIAPSFDEGVAVAEVLDDLKAKMVRAG